MLLHTFLLIELAHRLDAKHLETTAMLALWDDYDYVHIPCLEVSK